MSPMESLIIHFWNKVSVCEHGRSCVLCCWPWQGGTCRGYGVLYVPHTLRPGKSRIVRASRVCWYLTHDAWPGALDVLHRCDHPPCLQSAHLFLGSKADNQQDSARKGRRPTGEAHGLRLHPEATRKGTDNHESKLTPELVTFIRQRIAAGDSDRIITRILPVSVTPNVIYQIRKGITWKHIPEE